ncbi:S8 family serine peptidase, partial [Pseudomonas sp. GP01-A3]|uniref:S8 family serine peptidase n=1 Tax=Pseudomonas sp. GP01-A3 TaxID=2070568 RepID=UPI001C4461D2
MSQAVDNLSAETGSLFVIAAGNTGREGIGAPGAADAALTVGAVDKSDKLAYFSSRGPRFGSTGLKPDLTAPGVGINAARSQFANKGSGSYFSMNGTS